jgi:tetratricopeptide (TPR) repeat protein
MLDAALSVYEKMWGEAERGDGVASVYSRKGGIYAEQKLYNDAAASFAKALAVKAKIYGDDHVDVGALWSRMGEMYFAEGRLSEAREHIVRAFVIYQRAYGRADARTVRLARTVHVGRCSRQACRHTGSAGERFGTLGRD